MDENVDNQNNNLTDEQKLLEQATDQELLDAFVEDMMTERGLKQLEETAFTALKEDLKQRLNFQINRAILVQLPDEKLDEIAKVIDSEEPKAEEIDRILNEANVDVAETTRETMKIFREAYLGAEKAEA